MVFRVNFLFFFFFFLLLDTRSGRSPQTQPRIYRVLCCTGLDTIFAIFRDTINHGQDEIDAKWSSLINTGVLLFPWDFSPLRASCRVAVAGSMEDDLYTRPVIYVKQKRISKQPGFLLTLGYLPRSELKGYPGRCQAKWTNCEF